MPRKPRIEYAGAFYHVTQRGNNQETIFKTDQDKQHFIDILRLVSNELGCIILGYVIMDNHYHLLLQSCGQPLSKVMQAVNGRYAQRYNWFKERSGHVFQGRYHAAIISDERYLFGVLRYIHQNPVRAKICRSVSEYRWSSDAVYRNTVPGIVQPDFLLAIFSENRETAIKSYIALVESPVQGAPEYGKRVEEPSHQRPKDPPLRIERKTLDCILEELCLRADQFERIKAGLKHRDLTAIKLAYIREARSSGYALHQIGENISISSAAVSSLIKRDQAP